MLDVLIPTNGHPPHLSEAIAAIQSCVPVNSIFRADGGSLGEARQRLIDSATTDRFLFLDSDVVLEPGPWFSEAMKKLDDGASCVVLQPRLAVGPLESFVSFYWRIKPPMEGLFFGTMATFFKRDALKRIQIPSELSGAEDLYVMLWLMARKLKIEVMRVPGLHHHSSSASKGAWVGSSLKLLQKRVGLRRVLPIVLRNVVLYIPAVALVSLLTRDKKVMQYGLALWTRYVKAYLES